MENEVNEVKTSFFIKKDVLKAIKQKALDEETSIKEIINRYLIEGLERDEKNKDQTTLD